MLFPRFLSFLAIIFILAAPFALSAQDPQGLVPCTGSDCDFADLMQLVENIIDFAILLLMPLAAILFAYAGVLYLSSSVDPGKKSQAHKIFSTVAWGVVLTLSAWLIVKLISDALLQPNYIKLTS